MLRRQAVLKRFVQSSGDGAPYRVNALIMGVGNLCEKGERCATRAIMRRFHVICATIKPPVSRVRAATLSSMCVVLHTIQAAFVGPAYCLRVERLDSQRFSKPPSFLTICRWSPKPPAEVSKTAAPAITSRHIVAWGAIALLPIRELANAFCLELAS